MHGIMFKRHMEMHYLHIGVNLYHVYVYVICQGGSMFKVNKTRPRMDPTEKRRTRGGGIPKYYRK